MAATTVTDLGDLAIDPGVIGFFTRPDYFELLARLRREAPVFEYAPGRWTVATYEDVRNISRDPGNYCSGRGILMNDPLEHGGEIPGSIIHMDPPVHAEWRKITSRWFTPRGVSNLEPMVLAATRTVLDAVEPDAEVDLVEAVAAPIPVLVIAELLGVGDAATEDFRRWSDATIEGAEEETTEEAMLEKAAAVGELLEFLNGHVLERRRTPREDLLSLLVAAEVEGEGISDAEIVMYCLSLLVAGNETTRHLFSGSMAALFEHPDQRAHLAAHPEAIPDAVEECLRWVTPIQQFRRTATTDLTLGGTRIAEGDWVVLLYASANRDEQVWGPDADTFDVRRTPNPTHLGFGFGEHLCLGASLARLEGRVFLTELLGRYPNWEITGEPTWGHSTLVRGMSSLPGVLH